jgi:hypothetical protein
MQPEQPEGTKIAITERALYQRIKRKLKRNGECLRTARISARYRDPGYYYTVDIHSRKMGHLRISLKELGQELGVMQPWEQLEAK